MKIKHGRSNHLQRLVQDAKEFERKLDEAETITREDVEKAMIKKLQLAQVTSSELNSIESEVARIDTILESVHTEAVKLKTYKVLIIAAWVWLRGRLYSALLLMYNCHYCLCTHCMPYKDLCRMWYKEKYNT